MLYKDFGNLPYGSLCVSSIVKRAAVYLHVIAMDFESLSTADASLAGSVRQRLSWSRRGICGLGLSRRSPCIPLRQHVRDATGVHGGDGRAMVG